jgi:predicted nucleotidyltransferase
MHIDPKHLSIVLEILKKYPFTFYAFGSRVKGNPKKFSDLDLCFIENIPGNMQSQIDEDFEESDLPYKVDVINWNTCDESFQNIIRGDLSLVQLGENSAQLD